MKRGCHVSEREKPRPIDKTQVLIRHPMLSRALGRSARLTHLPLRNLHSRPPQLPFSLSHWTEPTGNGLVPIVIEQTVCVVHTPTPVNLPAGLLLTD